MKQTWLLVRIEVSGRHCVEMLTECRNTVGSGEVNWPEICFASQKVLYCTLYRQGYTNTDHRYIKIPCHHVTLWESMNVWNLSACACVLDIFQEKISSD